MSRKMGELYNKAVRFHDEGELEKAIDICEKAMSESLKNEAVLNLKGIILYQKGELDEAITVWNINREFNDNGMAKSYIKDSIKDREKIGLYNAGEHALKKLEVDKAIVIFKKCSESDFNTIKVNTALGMCYMKKGMPKEAREHIGKALTVDRNYKPAKALLKEVNEVYRDEKNKKSMKKSYIITFVIAMIIGGGFTLYNLIQKEDVKAKVPSSNENFEKKEEGAKKEEPKAEEQKKEIKPKEKEFKSDKVQIAIDNKDIYSMATMLNGVNSKGLNSEDKKIYDKAIKILKNEGVEKLYNTGQKYFNSKEYKKALGEFELALPYSKGMYLNEHVLYYLGVTEDELNNKENAIKYLEEYYKYYADGAYTDEVLYRLALINQKTNIEDSKLYARIIKDKYAKSMYNNQNINKILEK